MNDTFIKSFCSGLEDKPDMGNYYNTRMKIRELYALGPRINTKGNDLCSEILQLRDKNRCIESINLDTCNFIIEVELEEGTKADKSLQIQNKIANIIDAFVAKNVNDISSDGNKININDKLYDNVSLGNYIKFNL